MTAELRWRDALHAIDVIASGAGGLGGIRVLGGPGPVRDTWLDLLRSSLPEGMPFRRIPLNADAGRLLGGVDLAGTLHTGELIFARGLLEEARGGFVVLPMAERLEAANAALIASAIDGVPIPPVGRATSLEGEAVTPVSAIALDEGQGEDESPPVTLLERLAMTVDLRDLPMDVLASGGLGLVDDDEDDTVPDPVPALSRLAAAMGIRSLRADCDAFACACASARARDRDAPTASDVAFAVRTVLVPRAEHIPFDDETTEEPPPPPPPDGEPPEPETESESEQPRAMDDVVLEAARSALAANTLALLGLRDRANARTRARSRGAGSSRESRRSGRALGSVRGDPRSGARLDVIGTLVAAAPWQRLRGAPPPTGGRPSRLRITRADFRVRRYRERRSVVTIFAVDASGSTAAQRLAEAKGAVETVLAECYARRDKVAMVTFRHREAEVALPPTRSLVRARRLLAGLPGGGGTPLAAGLEAAHAVAIATTRAGATPLVVLLTDVSPNIALDGTASRGQAFDDALGVARRFATDGISCLLIDTSQRPRPRARELAEALDGRWMPLPHARPEVIGQAVTHAGHAARR